VLGPVIAAYHICFSSAIYIGMLAEQLLAGGPKFQLYDSSTQHWEQLMNWQHTTMYLFFAIAGAISLTVHSTDIAPLALDRMLLGLAFFNEGMFFIFTILISCERVFCKCIFNVRECVIFFFFT